MERHPEFKDNFKAYQREYYLKNKEKILDQTRKRNEGIAINKRIRISADEYRDITSGELGFILAESKEIDPWEELTLAEYEGKKPTGRELEIVVTYIKKDWPGLESNYCIIGFWLISK